jgi:hypothetical protein
VPFTTSEEFAAMQPVLAENSREQRDYYREELRKVLELARDYAFEEARREEIDRQLRYRGYSDEQERARREDLRLGAQQLMRDFDGAEASNVLRRDLLADAFGVAQYAVGIPVGEDVPLERLWTLADRRLRFVVGGAAVIIGERLHP